MDHEPQGGVRGHVSGLPLVGLGSLDMQDAPIAMCRTWLILMAWAIHFAGETVAPGGESWRRHVIDASSHGADGVRLGDFDGDGRLDVVTGWEEGGVVRACLNPGPAKAKHSWPGVTVGRVASPEDAVPIDLDRDGTLDVVSCCEGNTRSMFIHWGPQDRSRLLADEAWSTQAIPATRGKQPWMFSAPAQIDGQHGSDLFVGGKGSTGSVGWLQSPANSRDVAAWKLHPLCDAGWIMSLVPHDVDGDGDVDVMVSDRKGPRRGAYWLEHPGAARVGEPAAWKRHDIGASGVEAMFLTTADLDADGALDVVLATRSGKMFYFRRRIGAHVAWDTHAIDNPFAIVGGKAVHAADIDGDGQIDLVHTAETGNERAKPGLSWLRYRRSPAESPWEARDVSGLVGTKFDLVQTLDLDGDGDLDIVACEERANLGVVWFENPRTR